MKYIIGLNGKKINKDYFLNEVYQDGDIVVAVDGAYDFFKLIDVKVTYLIGDFDSLSVDINQVNKEYFSDTEVLRYPKDKDYTDGELAFNLVMDLIRIEPISYNEKREVIVVNYGSNDDSGHYLGNLLLLKKYSESFRKKLFKVLFVDSSEKIEYLGLGSHLVENQRYEKISIVPLCHCDLRLWGFKYNGDVSVDLGDTKTLRNAIKSQEGKIKVIEGEVLLVKSGKTSELICNHWKMRK